MCMFTYNKLVSLTTLRFVTWRQRRTFVSTEEMYIEIRMRERKKYERFDTLSQQTHNVPLTLAQGYILVTEF